MPLFFGNACNENDKKHQSNENEPNQMIETYGMYVFEKEKCATCHTLDKSNDEKLISLKGIGGKYSPQWHFSHLVEPKSTTPLSKMPAFKHLTESTLDKKSFQAFYQAHFDKKLKKEDITNLYIEVEKLQKELEKANVAVKNNAEILPLIAYLQTLKSTDAQNSSTDETMEKPELDTNNVAYKMAMDRNNVGKGKTLYEQNCMACHGKNGAGIVGPNLTDEYWIHGGKTMQIVNVIKNGVPSKGMVGWKNQLKLEEIGYMVAYIHSIFDSKPENAKEPQGNKE